jgi:GNAT superfamily N-acetyltransferase
MRRPGTAATVRVAARGGHLVARGGEEVPVSRRVERLTVDTLGLLPDEVRGCVAWELEPVERARAERAGTAVEEKEAWLSSVLLEWGSCGRVVLVDDEAAGYVLYAPPALLGGSVAMPTAPVSPDAVQVATAFVAPEYAGAGLGRLLMQLAVKDVIKRGGYRAVECFGTVTEVREDTATCCLPVEFLQRVGFRTARGHARHPRMRLDLRSVVTWREEVEQAWERLRGVVRPRPAAAPAPLPFAGPLGAPLGTPPPVSPPGRGPRPPGAAPAGRRS